MGPIVPTSRAKALLVTLSAALTLAACLLFIARVSPSEVPTIERLLPAPMLAELRRLRRLLGVRGDSLLVVVEERGRRGPALPRSVAAIERAIGALDGVLTTWSPLSRPRLLLRKRAVRWGGLEAVDISGEEDRGFRGCCDAGDDLRRTPRLPRSRVLS